MFAQYSPLFTAGLLSDSSPSSSRSASPKRSSRSRKTTHDSLPITVNSASFSIFSPDSSRQSTGSALYLTLKPSRKAREAGRSFLSLDLADTVSLRRKDTTTTRATVTSPTSFVAPIPSRNAFAHSHAPSTSSTQTVIPRIPTPILRRSSRETVLPSPKPAPSVSLPDVPAAPAAPAPQTAHKRRPSNLTLTFSACFPDLDLPSPTTTAPQHRPTFSAPAVISPMVTPFTAEEARSYFAFSPATSCPPTPPPTTTRPDSVIMPQPMSAPALGGLKAAPSCRSTATVNTRQRNRSAALAALEGRSSRRRAPSIKRPRNFMSMSDDEDEGDEMEEVQEENRRATLGVLEEEDVVLPHKLTRSVSESPNPSKRTSRRTSTSSRRQSAIETFLAPLTNFIDLRDGDDDTSSRSSRSWRSFVEIGP